MSFSSNAVIAKARAVFGRQLTEEDYITLTSKETIGEVCAQLKTTERYGRVLASENPQTVYRARLESLLRQAVYDIFDSFRKFDYTESKNFFRFVLASLEIEQVLMALQSVTNGSSDAYIAALPMFLYDRSKIDLAALGRAESLAEATELLRKTVYFKSIGGLLTEAAETGKLDITECERRLYTQYYMRMLKECDRDFKGSERKELRRAILRSVDMENVVTVYRRSLIFGSENADLAGKLIGFKYRLSAETVDRLAGLSDSEKIAAELEKLGYHTDGRIPETVELLTERINLDYLRKTMRLTKSSAVVYFALFECLNAELRNLKTVIEGVRYGMSGEEIMRILVY